MPCRTYSKPSLIVIVSGAAPCVGVYRTANGGDSWTLAGHLESAGMQAWQVDFADATHGWAVGVGGLLLVTADGGATWTEQAIPGVTGTPVLLTAVKAVNASTAWVGSAGGMLLKTEDGGATWLGQLSGTTEQVNSIDAVDGSRAWAGCGSSWPGMASLVATTDGGATWVQQPHPGEGPISSLRFVDASHGWAVGIFGLVMATTDGGATWTLQQSGTTQDLLQVVALGAATAWISTPSGLLGTSSGGF